MQHNVGSITRSVLLLLSLITFATLGCRTFAKAVEGTAVKVVADKVAPVAGGPGAGASRYYLIARDGTICQVTNERYYATSIGSEARCAWRASRAEASRDLAQP